MNRRGMLRRLFAVGAVAGAGVSQGSEETPAPESLGITFNDGTRVRGLVAHPDGSVHVVDAEPPKFAHLELQTNKYALSIGTADGPPDPLPGVDGNPWPPPLAIFGSHR